MTAPPDRTLVAAVRAGLAELADPAAGATMQAYMKSALPYHGVRLPVVRRLTRLLYDGRRLDDRACWEATVLALFDEATHREEWYAALQLVGHRYYRGFVDPTSLVLYEHLITTGAWWDVVDETSHRVGEVLLAWRPEAEPVVRRWSTSDDRWLRRASIICQLGHRSSTDRALLADGIDANAGHRDFFVRKAIGWALRDYARTDPHWVRAFVASRRHRLAPLSVREALKHVGADGAGS